MPENAPPATAVIDTSFWSLACLSGLEPWLWQAWNPIAAPPIVYQELFHAPRALPQQERFQAALQAGQLVIRAPSSLIPTLSKGEQAVVSLALAWQVPALIDDYRAHRHAREAYGVSVLSVAECLVWLHARSILEIPDAEQRFLQLKRLGATNTVFLEAAARAIHRRGGAWLWP